jgi:hypothetical protein
MSEWIHLRAPNDTNGNPRRIFVQINNGAIIDTADEGYRGIHAARIKGMPIDYSPTTFDVPASEYRILKNWKGGGS